MLMLSRLGCVGALAVSIIVPASAQYSSAPMPGWYDHGVMRQQTLNGWKLRDKVRQSQPDPAGGQMTVAIRRIPGATLFRPTGAHILPARLAAKTPRNRAEAEAWYERLLDAHAEMARNKGLASNDVARAASFAISSLYYVYRDGRDLDAAQLDGLRQQMTDIFTHDAAFQRLGQAARQELYEDYVIQGMAIASIYEGAVASKDRRKRSEMRAAARTSLEELLGVSPARLRFGVEGLAIF